MPTCRYLGMIARLPILLLTLLVAHGTAAQPDNRPSSASRVLRHDDFEERETNAFEVPHAWVRAQEDPLLPRVRPGFPIYNQAVLDYTVSYQGEGSVRIPVSGGSTSLRLQPRRAPVLPEADYIVSAWVKTEGLVHDAAVMVARFLDERGNPILGTERHTTPRRFDDGWEQISIRMLGNDARAAFLQIDLEVWEPSLFTQPALGQHHVRLHDLSGSAWFDDVQIIQTPRIELSTGSPGNVVESADDPNLHISVRDQTGESLTVHARIRDHLGHIVEDTTWNNAGGRFEKRWTPQLNRYGFYTVSIDVHNSTELVGQSGLQFVWMPKQDLPTSRTETPLAKGVNRFILDLGANITSRLDIAPDIARSIGVGGTIIPLIGTHGLSIAAEPDSELSAAIRGLRDQGRRVMLAIPELPVDPGSLRKTDDVVSIITNESIWREQLFAVLDRQGQKVRHWLLGNLASPRVFQPDSAALSQARDELASLVPDLVVALPWQPEVAATPVLTSPDLGMTMLKIDPRYGPVAIDEIVDAWTEGPAQSETSPDLNLVFDALDAPRHSHTWSASHLAKLAVAYWESLGDNTDPTMTLRGALVVGTQRTPQLMPTPELAAWRTLVDQLRQRRAVARFPVADGVSCVILAPAIGAPADRGGVLVAWNDSAEPGTAVVDAFLGDNPVRVTDIFGNQHTVEATGERARHIIPLTSDPIFIEDIDVNLVRFVASIRLEPAALESVSREHDLELVFENPWPVRVQGQASILEPGGLSGEQGEIDRAWRISPRHIELAADPGETGRVPLVMSFPRVEESGRKTMLLDISLTTDIPYSGIRAAPRFDIGLDYIESDVVYRFGPTPSGPDCTLEVHVTNTGDQATSLDIHRYAEGYPRERAAINILEPGQHAVRRFAFPGGADKLRGQSIFVSIVEDESNAHLNSSITIE